MSSIDRTEQFILLKRLLIIFGSICSVWCFIGFIFFSIQIYRYWKKRIHQKVYLYNRALQVPNELPLKHEHTASDNDNDEGDDQMSISTSVSFISERSKIIHEHNRRSTLREGIPEEPLEFFFPSAIGISNLAYSRSNLSSSSDNDTSLLYYPAYRNFGYSQSTLYSSDTQFHERIPTPSLDIPQHSSSAAIRLWNLKRPSSRASSNASSSQITSATYMSSQSTTKSIPLPTVMITDVDRLQTDIIELEDFEPEKDFIRPNSRLRCLLNDRLPQTTN